MLSRFSHVRLFARLWTAGCQAFLVHVILQARIPEWVALPSSRGSSDPGIEPVSPASPALQAVSLLLSHRGSSTTFQALREILFVTYINSHNDSLR